MLIFVLHVNSLFGQAGRCNETSRGTAIDWTPEIKLRWSDFRADKKGNVAFSVASSSCGFGYNGYVRGEEIRVSVFVRFYCEESWKEPGFSQPDVLQHEQLHFDICELYGRKLYQGIHALRAKKRLNEKNLQKLYNSLVKEYDAFQDRYDRETKHSTVGGAQKQWNERIKNDLDRLAAFADYKE
ncbi:MAG: DUF922 domain-containing protein [bacterium]